MSISIIFNKQQGQVSISSSASFHANFNITPLLVDEKIADIIQTDTVDTTQTETADITEAQLFDESQYDDGYNDGYDFAFRLKLHVPFTMVYPEEPYNNGFTDGYNAAWKYNNSDE